MTTKCIKHTNCRYTAPQKLQGGYCGSQIFPPSVIIMGALMVLSIFCALWVSSNISDIGYHISEALNPGKTVQGESDQLRIARSPHRQLTERLQHND